MDKDYNFSHQFYKKFIHNMVRKESKISSSSVEKLLHNSELKP